MHPWTSTNHSSDCFTWALSNHLQSFRALWVSRRQDASASLRHSLVNGADKDLWMMGGEKIQIGYKTFLLFFCFHVSFCLSSQSLELRKTFRPARIHISPQGLHGNQQDCISESDELRKCSQVCWSWFHAWTAWFNLETEYFIHLEDNSFVLIWREEC